MLFAHQRGFQMELASVSLAAVKIGSTGAFLLFCVYGRAQSPATTTAQLQYEFANARWRKAQLSAHFALPTSDLHDTRNAYGPGTGVGAGGQTRAYDNFGNEYSGEACTLAASSPVYGDVVARIESSPVEATVIFRHVNQSAMTLPLITVVGSAENVRLKVSF